MKWIVMFGYKEYTNVVGIIVHRSNIHKYNLFEKYNLTNIIDKTRIGIRHFSETNFILTNVKTKTKYFNEINDDNYEEVIRKDKTFCIFGYANYSLPCLSVSKTIAKMQIELKKKLQIENANIPLIYKLDINNNFELVKKFHIKTIPVIQLRHQQKLVVEISGDEVKERNIQNILQRFFSYFQPLELSVPILDDFIRREEELFITKTKRPNTISTDSISSEIKKKIENKVEQEKKNEMIPKNVLINLELKYPCKTYSVFKQLELALEEFQISEIRNLLDTILKDHNTYLDIHKEYNELVAKAFIYLFDEHNISLETITQIKNSYLLTNTLDPTILKYITFKEPIIIFDDFKSKNVKKLTELDHFFSQDNNILKKEKATEKNIPLTTDQNDKQRKNEEIIQKKYLSRIFRILAAKFFIINNFTDSLQNAIESYKCTFPLGGVEHNKSKVLIENIFLSLGPYNENVRKCKSQLEFLYTDKIFKVIRFPHTRAIRGGRPIMKRGKSGKWRWLSHDWKPRWLKKKTKLLLEEEWRVVPDKNVPFWN